MAVDVIVVGGGLGGSTLAACLAQRGVNVLVLERESAFKDRVRGENMIPWGVAAARRLGIVDDLVAAGAHQPPWWTEYAFGQMTLHRDLRETSPVGELSLNMYHPELQEALIARAMRAGADVRRGATVVAVVAAEGRQPQVTFDHAGSRQTVTAPVVVGADGRTSQMRSWGGFDVNRNPDLLTIAGTVLQGTQVPDDSVHLLFGPGMATLFAPLGRQRARAYFIYPGVAGPRALSGPAKAAEFMAACQQVGAPADWFEDVEVAGPLAEFNSAERWVDRPVRNGVALIGDAASSTDPSWGCGLSQTVTDVEHFVNAVAETPTLEEALERFAVEHAEYAGNLRRLLGWMTELVWTPGPEADERRGRVFPRMASEPQRFPDLIGLGPFNHTGEETRRVLLGIEEEAAL